jgi:hypothetical protein
MGMDPASLGMAEDFDYLDYPDLQVEPEIVCRV